MRADRSGLRGGMSGEDVPRISDCVSGIKELLREEESYRLLVGNMGMNALYVGIRETLYSLTPYRTSKE